MYYCAQIFVVREIFFIVQRWWCWKTVFRFIVDILSSWDNILAENEIINYWFVWWSGASHWCQTSSLSWLKIMKNLKYKIWNEEANFFVWLSVVRRKIYLRYFYLSSFIISLSLYIYTIWRTGKLRKVGHSLRKHFFLHGPQINAKCIECNSECNLLIRFYCQFFPYFQCLLKAGFGQTFTWLHHVLSRMSAI